jgi:hypothetical protein
MCSRVAGVMRWSDDNPTRVKIYRIYLPQPVQRRCEKSIGLVDTSFEGESPQRGVSRVKYT